MASEAHHNVHSRVILLTAIAVTSPACVSPGQTTPQAESIDPKIVAIVEALETQHCRLPNERLLADGLPQRSITQVRAFCSLSTRRKQVIVAGLAQGERLDDLLADGELPLDADMIGARGKPIDWHALRKSLCPPPTALRTTGGAFSLPTDQSPVRHNLCSESPAESSATTVPPQSSHSTGLPHLKFWVNAFIPNTLTGAFIATTGPYAGRQVFPSPLGGCFETDQRTFDSTLPSSRVPGLTITPSSRLQLVLEFDPSAQDPSHDSFKTGGLTFKIDCKNGKPECEKNVSPRGDIHTYHGLSTPQYVTTIDFDVSANDPCVWGAPDIRIFGLVAIDKQSRTYSLYYWTTLFPAMEVYLSIDGGQPITLNTTPPKSDSVWLLFVPAAFGEKTAFGNF